MTYFILLPDIQALFMTSLVQPAGHRMVARSLCRDIQTSIVNKQDKNISSKQQLLCVYFHSIAKRRASDDSRVRIRSTAKYQTLVVRRIYLLNRQIRYLERNETYIISL